MPRGRPREFDRDKALQDAMLLFWRNGYNAASIADLCEAMGITVKSLYAAFGNKEQLFVEAVGLYMKATQQLLWARLDEGGSAREGLRGLLRATSGVLTDSSSHPIGCWVTMSLVDENMSAAVVAAIRNSRSEWLDVVRAHLKSAAERGELAAPADIDSLARFFVGIVQAIGIQSHDGASREEMDRLIDISMRAWPANG